MERLAQAEADVQTLKQATETVAQLERLICRDLGYHPDLHPLYWPHAPESRHLISRIKQHVYRMLAEAESLARGMAIHETDYSFLGVNMTYVDFAAAMAKKKIGICPFCGRTGLTPRYGSINKHIKACAKKREET